MIDKIIDKITEALKDIPGIVAIVLGGSRARGNENIDSDIDIGIYYNSCLDLKILNEVSSLLDDKKRQDLIVPFGGWGPWVNAGGWLEIDGYHVDFILRDIKRVNEVTDECLQGKIYANYQTGHPHGFLNIMYAGEVAICKIIIEHEEAITKLKNKVIPYPIIFKETIIKYFLFETRFSLMFIEANIDRDDLSYLIGHCYRVIACLNQVIFALNESYVINEKKAINIIDTLTIKPLDYHQRIDEVLSTFAFNRRNAYNILLTLVQEIEELK